jgi:D-lactate dehydrogenase (cytochrome)
MKNKCKPIHIINQIELDKIKIFTQSNPNILDVVNFLQNEFNISSTCDSDIVNGFIKDSSNIEGFAEAVVRPNNTYESSVTFTICYKLEIPITISAGQTNLTGSATPKGGIVLSTQNMKSDIQLDLDNQIATISVGNYLEEFRRKIIEKSQNKLYYPPDPTSREDATIGGTIACNASGFIPGENGATRKWVNSIEFILPNGYVINAKRGEYISENGQFNLYIDDALIEWKIPTYERPKIKNASGPFSSPEGNIDFVDLIIGSEGIFGLTTNCTLKLVTKPKDYLDLFIPLLTENDAVILRAKLDSKLDRFTSFEYFGHNCLNYMDHRDILFNGNREFGVYLQMPIWDSNKEEAINEWFDILVETKVNIDYDSVYLMDSEAQRRVFFEARHSMPTKAVEKIQQMETISIITDAIVPINHFAEFLKFSHSLLEKSKMEYLLFGHLGDCHLHFHVLPEKSELKNAKRIYSKIIQKSSELGGVYSAEHGTGKRKRQDFIECYGKLAVDEIKKCKSAIDPKYLVNRRNVIDF